MLKKHNSEVKSILKIIEKNKYITQNATLLEARPRLVCSLPALNLGVTGAVFLEPHHHGHITFLGRPDSIVVRGQLHKCAVGEHGTEVCDLRGVGDCPERTKC